MKTTQLKAKFVDIKKSEFIRNVFTVATGTAIAQALAMAFAPIITRLYGPEVYGVFGVFTSIVGILTPVVALAYPIAIVLPKSDADAKALIRLSLYVAATISIVTLFVFVLFSQPVVHFLQIESVRQYLILIPFIMLFAAGAQVAQQWLIRKRQFRVRARIDVLQELVINVTKTGAGFINPVATVLIVVTALGQALQALLLIQGASKVVEQEIQQGTDKNSHQSNLYRLAKRYYDFPLYRAPQIFANGVAQSLPVLMLSAFFGPAAAGFYGIGRIVLAVPSQFIGRSVGDVFYPRIAEASNNNEKLTPLILETTFGLAAIGLVPFGIVIVFGPWLFGFVFGADWVTAGEYARWLALWLYFAFCNIPSVNALPVLSAQLFNLVFELFSIILRVSALALGSYVFESDVIAIALFGISGAIINIMLILITVIKSSHRDRGYE